MNNLLSSIRQFLSELKRRNVYRVAVTYLAVGFVVIEAADLTLTRLGLPGWTVTLVVVLVGLGFPIALVLAWALEVTPEGVRVEEPKGEEEIAPAPSGSPKNLWIGASILFMLFLAGSGLWYLNAGGEGSSAGTTTTPDTTQKRSQPSLNSETPRVAVLPFENIAPDSSGDYFARGMHEEVLNQLSKVSWLKIISRTSVMGYAETDKQIPEISKELGGVNAVLEGTVRRAAGRVRITTQLIEAPDDEHLWSTSYERALSPEAIFDIQANIAGQIASALKGQMTEDERKGIESAPTSDLAAYDAYLRGRNQWRQFWSTTNTAHIDTAITKLREAVRRDPTFAEAHAWLGLAYTFRSPRGDKGDRWIDSAEVAVERARSLNPKVAEAYVAQAFVFHRRRSLSKRVEALRRALQLQPSHAFAKSELSDALRAQGHYVEAVRVAHEAIQLDPRNPTVHQEMADQLRNVGLYNPAEAWDRRALEVEPGHAQALRGLMGTQLLRGEPGQAMQTWQRLQTHQVGSPHGPWLNLAVEAALQGPGPARAKALLDQAVPARPDASPEKLQQTDLSERRRTLLGLTELRLGNRERGRRLLRQAADSARAGLKDDSPNDFYQRFLLAEWQAALGETDRALNHLDHWRRASFDDWVWYLKRMKMSPFLDNLRSEPRFQQMLRAFESKQKDVRAQVRLLKLDLYPPGPRPNSTIRQTSTDG